MTSGLSDPLGHGVLGKRPVQVLEVRHEECVSNHLEYAQPSCETTVRRSRRTLSVELLTSAQTSITFSG